MGNYTFPKNSLTGKNQCMTHYTKKSQDTEKVGAKEICSNLKVFRYVASRVTFFLSSFFSL